MRSESPINEGSKVEQESLLPELLHALSQPLTSLRCSLEVTLLQPRDSEEYRKRLRDSLKLTEDITVLARGIRELIDVEQAPGSPSIVPFDRVLRSSVRELLPLADEQGVTLSLLCEPSLKARGDELQFFTAAMYFLSFVLNFAGKGDEVSVQATSSSGEVAVLFDSCRQDARQLEPALKIGEESQTASAYLKLLIARRIFEVAGGRVHIERNASTVSVRAWLPHLAAESGSKVGTQGESASARTA